MQWYSCWFSDVVRKKTKVEDISSSGNAGKYRLATRQAEAGVSSNDLHLANNNRRKAMVLGRSRRLSSE